MPGPGTGKSRTLCACSLVAELLRADTILISRGPGETRYALMAGDMLVDVAHMRDGAVLPGAVYFARIGAPVPHMPAVFVNLGDAGTGVLKIKPPRPSEGAGIAVTVVVPARGPKSVEVKLEADVPVPADGRTGALLRAAPDPAAAWWAEHAATVTQIVCDSRAEAQRLKALLGAAAPVEIHPPGADLFDVRGVDEAIEAALDPTVPLPCGGSLVIETTTAVITIDVNTGPADIDTANNEALIAVARELRRRNLAGHILVDVIPTRRGGTLPPLLAELTAGDPAVRVAGRTPLGMIELSRRRVGLSLAEVLCGPDGRLSAASVGYKLLRDAVRYGFTEKAARIAVEVSPEVADLLAGILAPARAEAEAALKGEIQVTARADLPRARFVVRAA